MSFFDVFVQARMRKMYPDGEIHLERSPYGNHYNVHLTIPARDIASNAMKEETLRYLDNKLFPNPPKPRKHWSIRGKLAGK